MNTQNIYLWIKTGNKTKPNDRVFMWDKDGKLVNIISPVEYRPIRFSINLN